MVVARVASEREVMFPGEIPAESPVELSKAGDGVAKSNEVAVETLRTSSPARPPRTKIPANLDRPI